MARQAKVKTGRAGGNPKSCQRAKTLNAGEQAKEEHKGTQHDIQTSKKKERVQKK